MPTNRTYRGRIAGQGTLSLGAIAYLRDDPYDPCLGNALWPGNEHSHLSCHGDTPYSLNGDAARQVCGLSARELVEQYGDQFLAEYVKAHPGQRPAWWWHFNTLDNGGPLLRQKVGGIGTPWGDHQMAYGAALVWVTEKNKTWWGEAPGPAVDPANPPIFESQATFLDRHDMFLPGERRRLTAADFTPEEITVDDDDDE